MAYKVGANLHAFCTYSHRVYVPNGAEFAAHPFFGEGVVVLWDEPQKTTHGTPCNDASRTLPG